MTNDKFEVNSQEFYYHVSPIHLEKGSIIKKGNWGRVIKLYMGNCNGLNLFRERVFENTRLQHFSNKPSRLDCSYLLLDVDTAFRYLKVDNEAHRTSLVYKVKVIDLDAKFHLGNFNKVTVQPPLCHFDHMDELANNYWNGLSLYDVAIEQKFDPSTNTIIPTAVTHIELLVESDIEIVECLNQ